MLVFAFVVQAFFGSAKWFPVPVNGFHVATIESD